jgi:hypothetical protein
MGGCKLEVCSRSLVCSLPVNTCVVSDAEKCVVIIWGIVGVYSHVCMVTWLGVVRVGTLFRVEEV